MRIISGSLKGSKLFAPKEKVRPTSDRVKESIFNMLNDVSGAYVLDLFCGSGALGIEALSRGAEKAVLVDQSHTSINYAKRNISSTGLNKKAFAYKSSVKSFLKKFEKHKFDLIFLDPPYKISRQEVEDVFELLSGNRLVDETSVVVLEHSTRVDFSSIKKFDLMKAKKYGDTSVSFFRLKKEVSFESSLSGDV